MILSCCIVSHTFIRSVMQPLAIKTLTLFSMELLKQARIIHTIELIGFFKLLQNLSAVLRLLSVLNTVHICNIYEAIHVQTFVLHNLTNCSSVKYYFKCLGFWTYLNVNKIRIWHFFCMIGTCSFREV